VGEKARRLWAKVQPGNVVAFHAKGMAVIGYDIVEGKFETVVGNLNIAYVKFQDRW
jgi:hypothetical protein